MVGWKRSGKIVIVVVALIVVCVVMWHYAGARTTPGVVKCRACGYQWSAKYAPGESFTCPKCKGKADPVPIYGLYGPRAVLGSDAKQPK